MSEPVRHSHTVSLRTYFGVFISLFVLTMATYTAAYMDFGRMNLVVALGIAITKATLVVLYFMHVKYGPRLIALLVATGFLWLGLLIAGVLQDTLSRGWLGH
jgi:cytochrome c oxidase subunit IV